MGRTSVAAFSDQCLVGVMGAGAADSHWPPDGEPPEDAARDVHGYVEDDHTLVELCATLDTAPDLVVSQLNGPDTAAHVFGPDSEAAFATYRATDAFLTEVREHRRGTTRCGSWSPTTTRSRSTSGRRSISSPSSCAVGSSCSRSPRAT